MINISWERFIADIHAMHRLLLKGKWLPDYLICPRYVDCIAGDIMADRYGYHISRGGNNEIKDKRILLMHTTPDPVSYESFLAYRGLSRESRTAVVYSTGDLSFEYSYTVTPIPGPVRLPWQN